MMLGLLVLFYLLQVVVVYGAARWDHALPGSRTFSQRGMAWLVTIVGTLYLPLLLLASHIMPLGDAFPAVGIPEILSLVVAVALLAWPPLRGSLMRCLRLEPERSLHVLLLYFMLGVVVQFGLSYPHYLMRGVPVPHVDYIISVQILLLQIGMLGVALVAAGLGSQGWRQVRQRLNLERRFGFTAMGAALLVLAVTLLIHRIVPGVVASLLAKFSLVTTSPHSSLPDDSSLLWVLISTVGAGIAEELFFRGLLQPRLGILFTSLLFTMIHLQYPLPTLVGMFLTTLLWGWLAKRYGVRASVFLHILHNLFVYSLSVLPAILFVMLTAAAPALCAGALLWLAGYGICRFVSRQQAPFTPQTRPWLAGFLGLSLFGGALYMTLRTLPLGALGWDRDLTMLAIGLGLCVFLACLPVVRRPLMRCLHLAPERWAHLLAFYALVFCVAEGLLWLALQQAQSPWMLREMPELLGEVISATFSSLFLGAVVVLGVGAGLGRKKRRQVFERLGFHRKLSGPTWCLAPAFASLLLLGGYGFCWGYAQLSSLSGGQVLRLPHVDSAHFVALAPLLLLLYLHACTQELLFRGAIQPRIGLLATSCVAALSGIVFILRFYGLSSILLPILLYAFASLALGWIARRYGLGMSMLTSCLLYSGVFFACFL